MAASIRFEKNGRRSTTYLSHGGSNLYATEQFAKALHKYSLAAVTKVSCTQIRVPGGLGDGGSGDYGSVFLYAKLLIKCLDDGKTYGILMSSPKASMFEEDQSVKQAIGEELTQAYATFAGKSFEYKEGWLFGASGDV
jgi:hypothetical protein